MSSVHPALALARDARVLDQLEKAPPALLYKLADGDVQLYKHALVEAGHIVDDTGKPHPKCPICKWTPGSDAQLSFG